MCAQMREGAKPVSLAVPFPLSINVNQPGMVLAVMANWSPAFYVSSGDVVV